VNNHSKGKNIRPMQSSDWIEVSKIYLEGQGTNLATFQSGCPPYEDWDSSHIKECRLVIENDGVIVGWCALSPVSSRCVYGGVAELSIYISAEHRGKGFGEILLNALVKSSENAGFWTLQSGIMQDNTASIKLHEKCGFRMVGYRERVGKDKFGVWRNTVLMERRAIPDEPKQNQCNCCCQK
jgi:phosphinothricin acetyltransferase